MEKKKKTYLKNKQYSKLFRSSQANGIIKIFVHGMIISFEYASYFAKTELIWSQSMRDWSLLATEHLPANCSLSTPGWWGNELEGEMQEKNHGLR